MQMITVNIIPMGKPRMTQRDKWAQRPCVMRYRAYADEMRRQTTGKVPADVVGLSWCAYMPMPKSWSKKKKLAMEGTLHRQKPDRDNIDKGILDILFKEDSGIAKGCTEKRWDDSENPRLEIWFEEA